MRYILILSVCWLALAGNPQTVFAQSFQGEEILDKKIDSLMIRYNAPGLQLAIVENEQIVYQKSYGWAEAESETPVNDSTLFRIASISKPITVVAILKLIENSQLAYDQLVFGENGILSKDYDIPDNEWIKKITIRHLVDHKSGWTNEPNDPMFWNPNLTQDMVIQRILSTRPPKNEPGTQNYYSNFGYCVLGRVIEKVSGMTYEEYVRKEVLLPCGITDMVIGGDKYDERLPNEAVYYSQEGTGAYMMAVRRMDSHGGWIASATDLVRFLMHIDRNPVVQDIIPPESMKGTYLDFHTWVHTGSLPGTATVIVRKGDAWGYAVLTNTRTGNILDEMMRIMNETVK